MMLLKDINLERIWPVQAPEVLAFTELKEDELYPHMRRNQILTYIEGALAIGKQAGKGYEYRGNLAPLMRSITKSGARVVFLEEKKYDGDKLIRAQYERHPTAILVYRPSLEQMERFFSKSGHRVPKEDLMALHMCHEWFHHLEETSFGRTDQRLPKVVVRKIGPVMFKQAVETTREIAAHAFTQEVMGLSWYPLVLDVLIPQAERNVQKAHIREHFKRLKNELHRETGEELTVV